MKKYLLFIISISLLLIGGCSDVDVSSLKEESKNKFNEVKTSISEEATFDREVIREKFYGRVNEIRLEKGKQEIEVSSLLEVNANECAKLDFFEECEIEIGQEGVNWEIPWNSNVEGCGFAQSSSTNVDCLIKSLEADEDSETRIYEYLLSKDKIGLGVIEKEDSISYSITLE